MPVERPGPARGPAPLPPDADAAEVTPHPGQAQCRLFASGTGKPLALVAADGEGLAEELLRHAAAAGDPEAAIQLCWNLYNEALFRQILTTGVPGDQAEDVLQDVFALLHREFEAVHGPRLLGWLRTVTDYECRRHLQRCARARRNLDGSRSLAEIGGGQGPGSPEALVEPRRGLQAVLAFLEQATPFEEAILRSALFEDRPVEEVLRTIAERFGRRLDRRQLARLRHKLRRQLAEHVARWRPGSHEGEVP